MVKKHNIKAFAACSVGSRITLTLLKTRDSPSSTSSYDNFSAPLTRDPC